MKLPVDYDQAEYARIKAAEKSRLIPMSSVVIGIGGSYLGAKAAVEMLTHAFLNNVPKSKRKGTEIYFLDRICQPTI